MTNDGTSASPGAPADGSARPDRVPANTAGTQRSAETAGAQRSSGAAGPRRSSGAAGARPAADASEARAASVRPLRRPGNLRRAPLIAKISMAVFTVGLVAILVEVAMVASGVRSLPLWLNLVVLLAPIGLLIGLLNTMLRARRNSS